MLHSHLILFDSWLLLTFKEKLRGRKFNTNFSAMQDFLKQLPEKASPFVLKSELNDGIVVYQLVDGTLKINGLIFAVNIFFNFFMNLHSIFMENPLYNIY